MEPKHLQDGVFHQTSVLSTISRHDLEGDRRKLYGENEMDRTGLGWRIVLVFLLLSLALSSTAQAQLTKEQGDRLERKIEDIAKNGALNPVRPKRTAMSEIEVNSYLAFNGRDKIPRGLANPQIMIGHDGQLSGRVLVDIDEFKRQRNSAGLLDPLNYVSGQVPLTARGVFRSHDGKGRFQLISAEIFGVQLPKQLVRELVAFFSRTAEYPNGFDMDAPFGLPAKIREVVVNKGEAVITQ